MTDLADHHITLGALWGRPGQELHERLMAAVIPARIFRILERAFRARIHDRAFPHPVVARALKQNLPMRVSDVQRDSGYSPRHFIALFRSAVGLTPKHYYRIQRFNAVVQSLASGVNCSLAELATTLGYSDQAHLTREFRDFAGITPTEYRPAGINQPLHHKATGSFE